MTFKDLPAFLQFLEKKSHLKRIKEVVSTNLEITEISRRFLHANGPALYFENVIPRNSRSSRMSSISANEFEPDIKCKGK